MIRMRLRQLFSVLLAIVLFGGLLLTNATATFARSLTPEISGYEVNQPTTSEMVQRQRQETSRNNLKKLAGEEIPAQQRSKNIGGDQPNKLERAADNIREKLNLDEPIPQSTKDFLHDVENTVDNINPLSGN